jgi:16S rRNA C967 or C1407 C5-methylase (RsmB/RsmF family)/NOL1/NOP2/fmu family ribosome biogenesis protein
MPANSKRETQSIQWHSVLGTDCLGLDTIELDQLSQSLRAHAPRCVRLNPSLKQEQLPFAVTQVPWFERGYWIDDPKTRPGEFLQFAAGDYYIQDASSMLALALCRVQPGHLVCDLCAAPGGKASGLLEQLQGQGFLLANEVIHSRLSLLKFALSRTGRSNHATCSHDVERLADMLPAQVDCVLVDAPCSGQSMIGRDKQSIAAFSSTQIEHSAARQQRIIVAAANLVRPGGRMVYSTCTFAVAENEMIVEQFLQGNSDWQVDPMPELEAWASPRLGGAYRVWPHRDKCDGGFAVALIRSGGLGDLPTNLTEPKRSRWQAWQGNLSDFEFYECGETSNRASMAFQRDDTVHLFCNAPWPDLPSICYSGIEVAQIHPKRAEPAYPGALVMMEDIRPQHSIELSSAQALQYVRGESIPFLPAAQKSVSTNGWIQVRWHGRPLAWGKVADGKLKNHFPKLLRSNGINLS